MWPEVAKVKADNRHELSISGSSVNERIVKDGLDPNIFELRALNFLLIHNTCLDHLPDAIEQLENLHALVMHTNKLQHLNAKVFKLQKLKLLDVSSNQIKEIGDGVNELINIDTLNFANNCLENFPKLANLNKLTVLNLLGNKLKTFPELSGMPALSEIHLSLNKIEVVPHDINTLGGLKVLKLSGNQIKVIPGELADCGKLKTLELMDNPIADNRLGKLIKAKSTSVKQLLDYVKKSCSRTATKQPTATSNVPGQTENAAETPVATFKYRIRVRHANDSDFKVVVRDDVKGVREYIVACVLNDVTFTPEILRKFIRVQNDLHRNICRERNYATIATHDRNKLPKGNLIYTTMEPASLTITPLNQTKPVTGEEYLSSLHKEAEAFRKKDKLNTLSNIHKYLNLVKGKPRLSCLLASSSTVISFPPLTNSEVSRIDVDTKSMFLEVTSSVGLKACKEVMEALIRSIVQEIQSDVEIAQIRCTDTEGTLKVVYPARDDLNFDAKLGIKIERLD